MDSVRGASVRVGIATETESCVDDGVNRFGDFVQMEVINEERGRGRYETEDRKEARDRKKWVKMAKRQEHLINQKPQTH